MRREDQRSAGDDHGHAEHEAAAHQIPDRREREHDPCRAERDVGELKCRPGEQHAECEHDHRDADEMAGNVALIAVVFGIPAQQFSGSAHGRSPNRGVELDGPY
jgi:hypothetical protein